MSARLTASQNKFRLIAVFLATVIIALTFQIYKGMNGERLVTAEANSEAKLDDSHFIGLRRAKSAEIRQALPDAAGKPVLLAFSSRFCHDCQRMAPVLAGLMGKYPDVYYRKIDVMEDQKKYPAILRTLQPVSVPVLVFIDGNGEIRNVIYNYQKPEVIAAALDKLDTAPATPVR